jgi:hypothetical protein
MVACYRGVVEEWTASCVMVLAILLDRYALTLMWESASRGFNDIILVDRIEELCRRRKKYINAKDGLQAGQRCM